MYGRKWKPSKTAINEYKEKMNEIDTFCRQNGICQSASSDSYYFTINGQKYRVGNHTVEASNAHAYNFLGEKVRDLYHENGRESDVIYITAGKTRIIEVYTALKNGKKVDGRGYVKE